MNSSFVKCVYIHICVCLLFYVCVYMHVGRWVHGNSPERALQLRKLQNGEIKPVDMFVPDRGALILLAQVLG